MLKSRTWPHAHPHTGRPRHASRPTSARPLGVTLLALLLALAGCASPAGQTGNGNIFSDAGTVFAPDGGVADGGGASDTSGGDDAAVTDTGPACTSACKEGEKRCDAAKTGVEVCADGNDDGCYEWGAATACGKSAVCEQAACVTQCPKGACTVKGTKKCGPSDDVLECGDFDNDGCNEWGKSTPCGAGKLCTQGFCAASCVSSCTTVGAKKCDGNSVVECGDHNQNGCLNWGKPATCGAKVCANGACEDSCKNECTTAGAKTCDGKGTKECKDYNSDGCLTWGSVANCKQDQVCSAGACLDQCKSECTAVGAKKCDLDKIVTCGDYNSDGCLEWGTPLACAKPLVCQGGFCATSCKNDCTVKGAKQCDVGGGVAVCDDYNKDGCLEWGTPAPCAKGTVCSNGQCALSCTDACKAKGNTQCVPGSTTKLQTCDDYNKDGCLEWGTATSCGAGLVCSAGKCAQTCSNTCATKGEKACDGNAVKTCGDYNTDGCLEWGTPAACESYELCVGALCKQKPAPAKVVISELLYDSVGKDTEAFVELKAPAGTDLSGFTLVGINGDGGAVYNALALKGKVGGDGLFVIAHTAAGKATADQADMKSDLVDFQNGPDSVQVRYGGTVVDAVGYGSFSGKQFGGEGTPAPDVAAGHSLARDAKGTDTDNNKADFKDVAAPTPGTANTAANKPPVAKLSCPGSASPGTLVQLDASGSYDPEGQIDQYTFDFGDGSALVKSATAKVNHTYQKSGTFTVKLTVIDNGGATDTATCLMGVSATNKPPVAKLVCPGSVALNQTFAADASGSSDPDGLIAKYAFDMGDGKTVPAGTASKANHAYAKAGTYTVTVTVTDDKSATAKATCVVKATAGTPPTVNIIKPFDGKQVTQGDKIPVIVDASAPPGKNIAKVELFADGKSVGTDTTAPYEFAWTVPATAKTGSKVVLTATATDSAATPGTSKPVSLLVANDKPTLSFTAVVSGKLKVVADASGSSDTETDKSKLQFRVDWTNDGTWDTPWALDKVYEHTFPKEGKYTIRMAVRDAAGQVTESTKVVTLSTTLTVSGAISTTTWTGTVVVTGDITVAAGQTLTIAPGTSVLFAPIDQNKDGVGDFDLRVYGKLVVKGTKDEPVVFTVYGATKTPGKGWNRVVLHGAGSVVDWAVFEYAQAGLEIKQSATVKNSVMQNNVDGLVVSSGGNAVLTNVTSKNNIKHGLYVVPSSKVVSSGGTWKANGASGIKTDNAGSGALDLKVTGATIEENKGAGVEIRGYATGLITKSLISNNHYEGLRIYAMGTKDPTIAVRVNNITENALVGARAAVSLNLAAVTTGSYKGTKYGSTWTAPLSGKVTNVRWGHTESDYYKSSSSYINGAVLHGTSSTVLASTTSSKSTHWAAYSGSVPSIRPRVVDSSSSYYGTTKIYGAVYEAKGLVREAMIATNSYKIDLRHNYWGTFPDVLKVVSLSHANAANLDGFVGKFFDKTWTRAPYYGGESITADLNWSGEVWLTGDFTIPTGRTVTVAPGTKIRIVRHDQDKNGTGDVFWSVSGKLITQGTSALPVLITPADTSKKANGWENLYVSGSKSGASLSHTIVEYGRYGVELQSGTHVLNSVTLRHNASTGLRVNGGLGFVVKKLSSHDNGGDGVWVNNATGLIDGGTVQNNKGVGVAFGGSGTTTTVKNLTITKNVVAGLHVYTSKPTLSQLNVTYNGMGVWYQGAASGSLKASNVKYNNHEGVFLLSTNGGHPNPLIDGNNLYGNSVKSGGVVSSPNAAATTTGSYKGTKSSTVFKTPKGEVVVAARWGYTESDYYKSSSSYISGYLKNGSSGGASVLSSSSSASTRWHDIFPKGAKALVAVVTDSSSSYYGKATLYQAFYRASNVTKELAAMTGSGKVKCTNNYWGTFLDVEKRLVLSRTDAIDFQGFKIGEVNGTGPQ